MKKEANKLITIICFFSTLLVLCQEQPDNIIVWQQEHKLQWEDFQGSPPSSDKIGFGKAGTASGIYFNPISMMAKYRTSLFWQGSIKENLGQSLRMLLC